LVFFSPSSVESAAQVLPFDSSEWNRVKYATIGTRTAEAVTAVLGKVVHTVPHQPTPDALATAIMTHDEHNFIG